MATGTTRPIRVSGRRLPQVLREQHRHHNAGITRDTVTPPEASSGTTTRRRRRDPTASSPTTVRAALGDAAPNRRTRTTSGSSPRSRSYNQVGVTMLFQALGSPSDLAVWKSDGGRRRPYRAREPGALDAGWVRGETDPAVLRRRIATLNAARALYDGYASPNSPGTLTVDTAKVFADGVVEYPAQTAAMLEPYNINIGTDETRSGCPGPARRGSLGRGRDAGLHDARRDPLDHPRPRDRQPRGACHPRQLRGHEEGEPVLGSPRHDHPPAVRRPGRQAALRQARRHRQHAAAVGREGHLHGRRCGGLRRPGRPRHDVSGAQPDEERRRPGQRQ